MGLPPFLASAHSHQASSHIIVLPVRGICDEQDVGWYDIRENCKVLYAVSLASVARPALIMSMTNWTIVDAYIGPTSIRPLHLYRIQSQMTRQWTKTATVFHHDWNSSSSWILGHDWQIRHSHWAGRKSLCLDCSVWWGLCHTILLGFLHMWQATCARGAGRARWLAGVERGHLVGRGSDNNDVAHNMTGEKELFQSWVYGVLKYWTG